MVNTCCVKGCHHNSKNQPQLRFHRFPTKYEDICKRWVTRCGISSRTDVLKLNNQRVCSSHFLSADYVLNSITLTPDACPTINMPEMPISNYSVKIHSKNMINEYVVKITDSLVLNIQLQLDESNDENAYTYTVTDSKTPVITCQQSALPSANTLKHLGQSIGLLKFKINLFW